MFTENLTITEKARQILNPEIKELMNKYIQKIPRFIMGPDRVSYIISLFNEMSEDDHFKLIGVFNEILKFMIEKDASDIELGGYGSQDRVWFRIHGIKQPVEELGELSNDESALLILSILNDRQKNVLEEIRNLDFSYTFNFNSLRHSKFYLKNEVDFRFRGDTFFDVDCLAMNMRSIIPELRSMEELGFHSNVMKALTYNYIKRGLILITGITGSGKSTTLDAIIDWHNDNSDCHIVTIASPLEYVHRSRKCLIRQREVGRDVRSFHEGVVQALRQDLDVMVIGEMRDPATILAALEITDTGHKVFSTLHTSSAIESLDRIVAEVSEHDRDRVRLRLADVLTAIVSLKLIPALNGKRVLAKEVLLINANVKAAIKNGNTSEIYMMINSGSASGMITMEQDLKRLYQEGKISLENALNYANNKEFFKQIAGVS